MDGINSEAAAAATDIFFKAALNKTELLRDEETGKVEIHLHNPSQICWQCPAPTKSQQHRWCSIECRDAWARENE